MITAVPARTISTECHTDEDAHAAACSFLARLIGSQADAVRWDATYHLQGHTFVDGLELVVIAPRDRRHRTLVVTGEDWDEIHRVPRVERDALLSTCSITSRRRLREVVAELERGARGLHPHARAARPRRVRRRLILPGVSTSAFTAPGQARPRSDTDHRTPGSSSHAGALRR